MIGVLLMSHGRMAEGMLDSCKLFFGNDVEKIKALCLLESDSPEEFDIRIKEAVAELDDGSGVIGMCDLFGGTPSNRSVYALTEGIHFRVITGMNLGMLIELLGVRSSYETMNDVDLQVLLDTGKTGMVDLEAVMKNMQDELF